MEIQDARPDGVEGLAARLRRDHGDHDGTALLEPMIRSVFPGRIAVVASFGTESALLLSLVADIDPTVPVVFLETGKHFEETLAYRDELRDLLGLTDVRSVKPDWSHLLQGDPDGSLWQSEPNVCCHIRKVLPLRRALAGFEAWISGRKRYHGGARSDLPAIEVADGRIKINPLAGWSLDRVEAEYEERGLPQHPLLAEGYHSVGCEPCTSPSAPGAEGGADLRAGRWAGLAKTECGIHFGSMAGAGC